MAVKVHWFQIEPNLKEYEYEFTGLSTDEKPQDERVAANSLFLELDTGDFYFLKQAASSSIIRTEILEETSFQPIDLGWEYFFYPFSDTQVDMETGLTEDNYKVVYDGQTYSVDKVVIDDVNYYGSSSYSFIDYPFVITCRWIPRDGYLANICVPNMNEHTVEIYTEETVVTEAVWEKVGSGGSEPEPSGEKLFEGDVTTAYYDGDIIYEFDPVLALNYSSLIVEFEGTKYTVSNLSTDDGVFEFGHPLMDWSECPFYLYYTNNDELQTLVSTESAGTYSLKIWANSEPLDTESEPSGEKLFDGNVTTVEDNDVFVYEFSPMVALNYSSIIVEFDGTRYTAQNYTNGENWYAFGKEMGSPSDEYPFGLVFGNNGNQGLATQIYTESAGTYSLKIWANSEEGEMPVPVPPLG